MKNLVLIYEGKNEEFDTFEELEKFIIGDDFENISEILYKKAFPLSKIYAVQIYNTKEGLLYNLNDQTIELKNPIIIDNVKTYLLSLCRLNIIMLLEKRGANIFTQNINIPNNEDNYIVINSFANEILSLVLGGEE